MKMERNEIIYETAKFFVEKSIDVHIKLKSGEFRNGSILELRPDRLFLQDERLGIMPIFFESIRDDGIVKRKVRE